MTFDLQYTDPKSNARAGLITTDHGQIETPIFMPVGTLGTVKGVHLHELKEDIKAQIILGNTYHIDILAVINEVLQVVGITILPAFAQQKNSFAYKDTPFGFCGFLVYDLVSLP